MVRADSLAGTPDNLALAQRLADLEQRLAMLEDPDHASLGGGFLLTPDEDTEGQVNIETDDGTKVQIFPPPVTPQMIEDLWDAINPETINFPIQGGTGTLTRIGRRVWLNGICRGLGHEDWHNGTRTIAQVPEEFRPNSDYIAGEDWLSFAVACAAEYMRPRTSRIDVNSQGKIVCYSLPTLKIEPNLTWVPIKNQYTDGNGSHSHDGTGTHGHSGNTGAASAGAAHTHPTGGGGGGHGHGAAGSHSHWISDLESSIRFDRNAELVYDTAAYPAWVALDGATWITG